MKKNSFLTLCFAFIPGAGQMYLGMMKKGLAVMLAFWCPFAIATLLGIFGFLLWLCPVVWFYSFFETMNCKWMDEAQRREIDSRAFAFLQGCSFEKKWRGFSGKSPLLVGWGLILLGVYLVLDSLVVPVVMTVCEQVFGIDPWFIQNIFHRVPSAIVAILIIALGVRLVRGKKTPAQDDGYVEYKGAEKDG